jgi:hypothetical protein
MIKWPHVLLIVLLLTGCKKAFNSPGALSNTNKYLVIDGIINTGNDSTFIRLSQTNYHCVTNPAEIVIGKPVIFHHIADHKNRTPSHPDF